MLEIIPRDSGFEPNPAPTIWDQQVPFDFASGFSGQWVLGPTRIDISTGDITNDTPGGGFITGFNTGASGFSGFSGAAGGDAGKIFYPDPSLASDINGYFTALPYPSPNSETSLFATLSGTGDVLLGSFATPLNNPGVTDFPAGTSLRRYYASTGADNQIAKIKTEVYICDADGSGETLIKSGYTDNFSGSEISLIITTYSDSFNYAMTLDQRLVFKIYGSRVSGPTTLLTIFFDGNQHATNIQTTITSGAPGTSGISGFSGIGTSGFSGESGFSGLGLSGFSGAAGTGSSIFHQFMLMGA